MLPKLYNFIFNVYCKFVKLFLNEPDGKNKNIQQKRQYHMVSIVVTRIVL